jgi:hypothetical protein
MVPISERFPLGEDGRGDRGDGLAFTGDLGGDALPDLRLHPIVDEEERLGLAQEVDEPGSDHPTPGVDAPARFGPGQVANRDDAVPLHAHVGPEPRSAGPVHDPAGGDHQVEDDREQNHHGASSVSIRLASSTVAGSRPMSRAMRTAFSTSSPLERAICVPPASR